MRGRVKNINENKEFGFILGEDAKEYFFHFNNVKSVDLPVKNSIVNFNPSSSDKGPTAVDVTLESKGSKMIKIGEDRIDINEIKAYGRDLISAHCGDKYSKYSVWEFWIDTYNGDGYTCRGSLSECDALVNQLDKLLNV